MDFFKFVSAEYSILMSVSHQDEHRLLVELSSRLLQSKQTVARENQEILAFLL